MVTPEQGGILTVFVDRAEDLKAGDLRSSDPFAELRIVSMHPTKEGAQRTKRVNHTLCPTWGEELVFHVLHPRDDELEVKVYDHNAIAANELLGVTRVPVAALLAAAGGRLDEWKDLRRPSDMQTKGQGRIHLVCAYAGEGSLQPQPQAVPQFQPPGAFGLYPPPASPTAMPQQQRPPSPVAYGAPPPQMMQQRPPSPVAFGAPPLPPPQMGMMAAPPPPMAMPAFVAGQPPPVAPMMPQQQQQFVQPPQHFTQPPPHPSSSGNVADPRPTCQYGMRCYRKNPVHFREMRHPPEHPLAQPYKP